MSLKLQQYAFIQLEEAAVVELHQGGGGYAGGREGGRMSDGEASALPLSRSDRSLVCSSCQHHGRLSESRRERGPVDHITAMTYSTHRACHTPDSMDAWS